MKQEDKELLLRDLCARLPYKVIVEFISYEGDTSPWFGELSCKDLDSFIHDVEYIEIKPYLRPMSSMTEEEKEEYCNLQDIFLYSSQYPVIDAYAMFDWLNAHYFDYRGLIEKGLAIAVTEDNNPYKD